MRASEARFRARLREVLLLGLAGAPVAGTACSTADSVAPTVRDAGASSDASPTQDATLDATALPIDAGATAEDAPLEADPCAPVRVDPSVFGTDGACDDYVLLPCGIPADASRIGCSPQVDLCTAKCPAHAFFECSYPSATCDEAGILPDAQVFLECGLCVGDLGRRPSGLREPERTGASSAAGDYFARAAFLEAASVDAFERLADALARLDAPASLRKRALQAARDERRHARTTARLARRFGAEPPVPAIAPAAPITLEALARENVVEGCVRESFAALLAMHQAARATDPHVARVMRGIARDEARHAALSWAIHAWAARGLDARARMRVTRAGETALKGLGVAGRDVTRSPSDEAVARLAGLPSVAAEERLATAFRAAFSPRSALCSADSAGRRNGARRARARRVA